MTPIVRLAFSATLVLALSGCANCTLDPFKTEAQLKPQREHRRAHAAAAPAPEAEKVAEVKAEVKEDKSEEGRRWCGQRFIDYTEGKRPGDAKTLEQKQADDHLCAALGKEQH
jgi:hypothetical protein